MMSPELRTALVAVCAIYRGALTRDWAANEMHDAVQKLLADDARAHAACARLSSARVTVDPQILIDARVEFAALYECTSAYRGDRLPIKRDGVGEIFERANKMIGRLDAVIADLPKE